MTKTKLESDLNTFQKNEQNETKNVRNKCDEELKRRIQEEAYISKKVNL